MLGDGDGKVDDKAKDSFTKGNAEFYGTMTNNYRDVSSKLTGQFRIISYDADKIYCEYANVWGAKKIDKAQDKATLRLLTFMLNDSSQSKIHINNRSENWPINDETIEGKKNVYIRDYEGFFDNKDKYVFEK